MPGNRIYYHLKPYLPWRLRIAMRRVLARLKRRLSADIWPINETAGRLPEGWPGWPEGRKFALVLTHDVEGPEGLAKCRQLMQLEQEAGCRSSFNFIPEGDYYVSRELREELKADGFEVGVHDLHHDGKLYQSESAFAENAKRINEYLKKWGAVGFRSGFMLHELDWLRQLNVAYDASTFDTDPFEPQPEPVGTIFPFWVPDSAGGSGYVELPYSLPQDSTLFLVLRETSPEIWLKKLDWVASRGGMALVNVHPDYVRFPGEAPSARTFPSNFYRQLLDYARQKYGASCWQPLPGELARWYGSQLKTRPAVSSPCASQGRAGNQGEVEVAAKVLPQEGERDQGQREKQQAAAASLHEPPSVSGVQCASSSRNSLRGKRAAVLLYAGIVSDARPRYEMEALLNEGMSVDLICLRETADEAAVEVRGQLRITRIPVRHGRDRKAGYFWNYGRFFLRSFVSLAVRSVRKRYDLVHVHNMPDVLAFAALAPRLRGAKIVLDLHDPMPELYQTIYQLKPDARMIRLLKKLEQWSIRFAHLVLTPNEAFRKVFCARGCPPEKIQIVMNTPDEGVFRASTDASKPPAGSRPKGEFRVMYHGLIVERHGLGTAIQAVRQLSQDLPQIRLDLFGDRNDYLDQLLAEAKHAGLNGHVSYHGKRRLDDMPAAILEADLGIIPNSRTPFTEINFPTRIFEYLCLGKPVIVPDTKGIRDYFDETQIFYFEPGSADDLARVIRWVYEHPAEVASRLQRGREVYEQHLWSHEKCRLVGAIGSLFRGNDPGSARDDKRAPY